MYYVYILQSSKDKGFYIGFTGNLRLRFHQHQNGESRSTAGRRPWTLIYYEAYCSQEDAIGRERFLKSGAGRQFMDKQLKNYMRLHPRRRAT